MSKPWDKLRVKPQGKPDPIGDGEWGTTSGNDGYGTARIEVRPTAGLAVLRIAPQTFDAAGLGELIEFLTELKSQLESK